MTSAFYVTLLILTTLFWGYLFYKKDYHPQPLKVIGQSFAAGLLSMLPVFGYKYAYQNFLPALAEYQIFRPLLDSPLLSGVTIFGMNLVILSLMLLLFSGAVSLLMYFFNHSVLKNLKAMIKDEPLGFVMVSMMIGGLMYAQHWIQTIFNVPVIGTVLGTVLFLAIIEEYVKHLMVRIADDKKLRDIDDAITLSIVVGLAFAFLETIIYSIAVGEVGIIFYRTMISIPIHVVASGIFGYYYGLAHFAKPIVKVEGGEKTYKTKLFHKLLTLKRSTVYHEEKLIEGILFATLFHAGMNLFFEFSLGFIAVPLIIGGLVMLSYFYKKGQKENRLIQRWKVRQKRKAKLTA